jgi:hypothetical protein
MKPCTTDTSGIMCVCVFKYTMCMLMLIPPCGRRNCRRDVFCLPSWNLLDWHRSCPDWLVFSAMEHTRCHRWALCVMTLNRLPVMISRDDLQERRRQSCAVLARREHTCATQEPSESLLRPIALAATQTAHVIGPSSMLHATMLSRSGPPCCC